MNPKHIHILQHSLGCDEYGRGTFYRNRYIVGPDSREFSDCRELVELGLMIDHGPQQLAGGMHCFSVTDDGKRKMRQESPTPPKVSRSRQRYLRWLELDCGIPFGDWLKMKEAK